MYKLLIADDEPIERQVLRYFVEQSDLEIESIYEASNGIEAVEIALSKHPDICILDIKMPGKTGFEVMEEIHSINSQCKVVFSTAYSDFEYAIKALHLGALDYLVKPVTEDTLIHVLTRAIDELDEIQSLKKNQQRITDMSYVLEKRILKELATGQIDEETLWFLDYFGLDNKIIGAAFFWRLERTLSEDEKAQLSIHLRKQLTYLGYQHLLYVHKTSIDLLILGPISMKYKIVQPNVLNVFERTLHYFNVPAEGSVGPWVDDIFQIELSYIEAKKNMHEQILSPVVDIVNKPKTAFDSFSEFVVIPQEIKDMCAYLEEHYNEEVSLEDVTKEVGFSKFHGCRLFKQYMGTTIIDYLIQIRMTKAKKLLKNEAYSIKQISSMIGYKDPNYFTWSFKKATGISPVKYRYEQTSD